MLTQGIERPHFFWSGLNTQFHVTMIDRMPDVSSEDDAVGFMISCNQPEDGVFYRPAAIRVATDTEDIILSFDLTCFANVPHFLRYYFMPQIETFDLTMTDGAIEDAIERLHPILSRFDSIVETRALRNHTKRRKDLSLASLEPDLPKPGDRSRRL